MTGRPDQCTVTEFVGPDDRRQRRLLLLLLLLLMLCAGVVCWLLAVAGRRLVAVRSGLATLGGRRRRGRCLRTTVYTRAACALVFISCRRCFVVLRITVFVVVIVVHPVLPAVTRTQRTCRQCSICPGSWSGLTPHLLKMTPTLMTENFGLVGGLRPPPPGP